MSKKRSIPALSGEASEQRLSYPHVSGHGHAMKKIRKRSQTHDLKNAGVRQAKKRARTIQRLFQKDNKLPENVRRDLDRELTGLEKDITNRSQHKRRSQMISKYHMVRFFERRKAERLVKRLQTKIKEAPDADDLISLKADLHTADVDLHYTKYFPFLEPYISLYSKAKEGKGTPKRGEPSTAEVYLRSERPPVWKEIESAMKQGEHALITLRERKHPLELTHRQKGKSKAKENKSDKERARSGFEKKLNLYKMSEDEGNEAWNYDDLHGDEEYDENEEGGFFDEDN